jgi:hypothetical protein
MNHAYTKFLVGEGRFRNIQTSQMLKNKCDPKDRICSRTKRKICDTPVEFILSGIEGLSDRSDRLSL